MISMRSLKAANGSRIGVSSYPLPSAAGVHLSMMIPFGTVKNESRVAVLDAGSAGAPKAGNMASRSGNATAVPDPRKNVRREIDFLKIIILCFLLPWAIPLLIRKLATDYADYADFNPLNPCNPRLNPVSNEKRFLTRNTSELSSFGTAHCRRRR